MLTSKKEVIQFLRTQPKQNVVNTEKYELQKEIDRLKAVKADYGKNNSRLSNKYKTSQKYWVSHYDWEAKDINKFKLNQKKLKEYENKIKEVTELYKMLNEYKPIEVEQQSLNLIKENNMAKRIKEEYKGIESIYSPSIIYQAVKKEQEWYKSLDLQDNEVADKVMLFIIVDKEIKGTKLIERDKVYSYKPEENEYYLDRIRDTGDIITDYNLEPAQKLVDSWNGIREDYRSLRKFYLYNKSNNRFKRIKKPNIKPKASKEWDKNPRTDIKPDGLEPSKHYLATQDIDEDVSSLCDKIDSATNELKGIITNVDSLEYSEDKKPVVEKSIKESVSIRLKNAIDEALS